MSVPYYGDFAEDDTVDIIFNAFTSNDPSASATITNFINTDVHIHKDLGVTQRNNAAGITVFVDFDGITGNHAIKIDTSDDTVGGFWVTGSEYQVRIEGTTVDAGTINAWVGSFSIERAGGVLAKLKAGNTDVNTKTFTAGSLANATFNADVGSTAHGTNIIALAVRKILEELNLDHLLKVDTTVAADGDLEDYCVGGTVMAHLLATGADATLYKASTDSMQAIRDVAPHGSTMVGTDNAALASVVGALDDAAAAGEVTTADTLMQYLKQLINILIGTTGIVAFPTEGAPANGISLAEVIRAIHADVTGLNGSAMIGTNNANTTVPDAAGTAASLHSTTDGKIDALNNLSTAQVNTEVDNALNTAIPGTPTADSINERIKALDDLKPGSTIAAASDIPAMRGTDNAATETKQDIIDGIADELRVALVNKMIIREAAGGAGEDAGDTEQFDESNNSLGTIDQAFTSDGTFTTRVRMVI